mmetsp:Transcript_18918/g.40945  ORF Transcript_18918/g.40945 Transcript_18918/m.40945 type:complete len:119 (+) Transcript_18918:197-553(+)
MPVSTGSAIGVIIPVKTSSINNLFITVTFVDGPAKRSTFSGSSISHRTVLRSWTHHWLVIQIGRYQCLLLSLHRLYHMSVNVTYPQSIDHWCLDKDDNDCQCENSHQTREQKKNKQMV